MQNKTPYYDPEPQLNLNLDITAIVNDLFDYERILFNEHYLKGRTFKEIGKISGVPEQEIKRMFMNMRNTWLLPQLKGLAS